MKLLLCIGLICFSATAALAQSPVVFGDYDCGQWVAGRQPARSWVLGLLSGLNYAEAKPGNDPLDKVNSADQIFLWLDNYCKANPLRRVSTGAVELYYRELKQKRN